MNRILQFVRRERLYLLLLVFVILLNIANQENVSRAKARKAAATLEVHKTQESVFVQPKEMEAIMDKNKNLAVIYTLTSFLVFLILILGIVIDAILLARRISGKNISIQTYVPQKVLWNSWDVAKVAILFTFFGYMIVMAESALVRIIPILKNQNIRMILNSSILDALTIVFIIYFTVMQYGQNLASLGISLKNFFKNVFYGIMGYIAAIPLLVAILLATAIISAVFKYVPEKQHVVQLFLKEKDVLFLLYTSIFAAVAGPIIEELFFRGFMYNAFKKYMPRVVAMFVTAGLFAALHAHPVGFLPIMALGVILAYMYEKTGTLVSSMTIHIIHNLAMVYFVFLAKSMRI